MITPKNVKHHELIGLNVEVVGAKNQNLLGIRGIIRDETKNMLVIETAHGEKKVLKTNVKIRTILGNETVIIDGTVLVGRPEDRLKK